MASIISKIYGGASLCPPHQFCTVRSGISNFFANSVCFIPYVSKISRISFLYLFPFFFLSQFHMFFCKNQKILFHFCNCYFVILAVDYAPTSLLAGNAFLQNSMHASRHQLSKHGYRMKLHYSQTSTKAVNDTTKFESPIKLHYSQTSNPHQNAGNGTTTAGYERFGGLQPVTN